MENDTYSSKVYKWQPDMSRKIPKMADDISLSVLVSTGVSLYFNFFSFLTSGNIVKASFVYWW